MPDLRDLLGRRDAADDDRPRPRLNHPPSRLGRKLWRASCRVGRISFFLVAGLAAIAAFAMSRGPMLVEGLGPKIAEALDAQGGGLKFTVGPTSLAAGRHGLGLLVAGLSARDGAGRLVFAAPKAEVGVAVWSLLVGKPTPNRLDFTGLALHLRRGADGVFALQAGDSAETSEPIAPAVSSAAGGPLSAVVALADRALSRDGPLGALEEVGIADGKLVVDGPPGAASLAYGALDLSLARRDGGVRLKLVARGPAGPLDATLDVADLGGGAKRLSLAAGGLDLADAMAAMGIAAPPIALDGPLAANLEAT
ncbi:MAG: hypothetical protein KGQ28_10960, partial [Hyphomicrobiales bacterium]|nr:hypothetical protein [Hyphomicrobiales bacterium]